MSLSLLLALRVVCVADTALLILSPALFFLRFAQCLFLPLFAVRLTRLKVFRALLLKVLCFFFFNDPAPTEIYPLPLHDALPIYRRVAPQPLGRGERPGRVADAVFAEPRAGRGDRLGVAAPREPLRARRDEQRGVATAAQRRVHGPAAPLRPRPHHVGEHGHVICGRRHAPGKSESPACRGRRGSVRHPATRVQAGLTGLEPATSGVTDRHSNQLSYSPLRRSAAI